MDLRAIVTAETPLSFDDNAGLETGQLARYVPGSSLLGAFAAAHQHLRNDPDEFARFFLQGKVRFGNCYPADFSAPELSDDYAVRPLPLTARSCKRFGGFAYRAQAEGDVRAGVTDLLIPLALFAISGESRTDLLAPLRDHPRTGQPLDRIGGYYRRGADPAQIGRGSPKTGLRTRTGINYRTGAVQPSILYSRQILAEGSRFWGHWSIDDAVAAGFREFVAEVASARLLRLGNNRTRGFGLAKLITLDWSDDSAAALGQRITDFSLLLRQAAERYSISLPGGVYVPITLVSDALLHDELGRSRLQVDLADLAAYGLDEASLVFSAAGTRRIRGWNSLWGLPKAVEWAIAFGAVFLFRLPRFGAATWDALLQLQRDGLGSRRAEGFGAITIADRFHLESAGGVYR